MKTCCSKNKSQALTLVEVVAVIFALTLLLAVLAAIILPAFARAKIHSGPTCANNLKQIGLSFQIWAGDNNGKFPMEVPVKNGGAMESAIGGNVVAVFQVISNELGTPKILVCQNDKKHVPTTNFGIGLGRKNISYFIGLDATHNSPQDVVSGDDNLIVNGTQVQSGVLNLWTNSAAWSKERHHGLGYILLTDGSVQSDNRIGFNSSAGTFFATNRLAIP